MASTINAKTTGVGGIDATGDASGVLALQTGGTTAVTIGASQNVGIGRTPTGFKLEIQSGLCCYTTSVQTIFRSHPSDGNGELGTLTAHAQTFITNSAERMRIDASGNVGIGTSSPSARLNVIVGDGASATNQVTISGGRSLGAGVFGSAGSILFSNSYWGAGYGVASICGMDSGTSGGYLGFSTTTNGSGTTGTPTERMRIDSTGQQSSTIVGYGTYNEYKCRAWVNFNGSGTVAIRASGNVSSITDNGTGDYTVNFTTAMPDANYAAIMTTSRPTISADFPRNVNIAANNPPTTSAVRLFTDYDTDYNGYDNPYVSVSIFR